jgi:uncharacterized protein (TIGR02271 family)
MPKTLTARFPSEEEAERALSSVASKVPLRDSAVMSGGPAGALMLESLHLTPEERSSCEQQLSKGGFLLVAQVASESRGEEALRLLDGLRGRGDKPQAPAEAPPPAPAAATEPAPPVAPAAPVPPVPAAAPTEHRPEAPAPAAASSQAGGGMDREERIPLVEEELRIGKREVVRGRARVRTYVAEIPVQEQVELLHEEASLERRPVNRRLSEEQVAQGGLLQERVIEITEMREEAVVTKEAFVREELVVTKNVHRRVEQINETVRRTEVETERLAPGEGSS